MIGVKNNSATQPSKEWRCRSAIKFSYCQSFCMMKLCPFWDFESISCKSNTFFFVVSYVLVWKRIEALAQPCRAADRNFRKLCSLNNFVTILFETQCLAVAMQISETDAGTLKVNANWFHETLSLRKRIDTDGWTDGNAE